MHLTKGTKEWRFFDHLDKVPFLYRKIGRSVGFEIDTFALDSARFPLANEARVWSATQEAGDLIFIPAGCPHAVRNTHDITALSMNYMDDSNYWLYLFDQVSSNNFEQLEFFTEQSFPLGLSSTQEDVTFGRFKSTKWRNVKRDLDLRGDAISVHGPTGT
jgi:hypothetical protein